MKRIVFTFACFLYDVKASLLCRLFLFSSRDKSNISRMNEKLWSIHMTTELSSSKKNTFIMHEFPPQFV